MEELKLNIDKLEVGHIANNKQFVYFSALNLKLKLQLESNSNPDIKVTKLLKNMMFQAIQLVKEEEEKLNEVDLKLNQYKLIFLEFYNF